MSKISKIQFKYDFSQNHTHTNILADQNIDYLFRLGINDAPNSLVYSQEEGQLGSFSHSYTYNYRITIPSISVIPSISLTSLEFKSDYSNNIMSTGIPSSNNVISYYPFGIYGDKLIGWRTEFSYQFKHDIYFHIFYNPIIYAEDNGKKIDFSNAGGLIINLKSPLGPIKLTWSYSYPNKTSKFYLSAGYKF